MSKVREYYGMYKHICTSILINYTEFEQIFGELENEFDKLDLDGSKCLDAYELFTGIAIVSDSKPNDKFSCNFNYYMFLNFHIYFNLVIFYLFDHNDIQSISFLDMIHLLETAIISILNIYKLPVDKVVVNDDILFELLKKYAFPTKRINKNLFERILTIDPYIKEFLDIVQIENYEQKEIFNVNEKTLNTLKDEYIRFKQNLLYTEDSNKNQLNYSKILIVIIIIIFLLKI